LREDVENKYDRIKMKRIAENNMKGRQRLRIKIIRRDIYFVEVLTINILVLSCLAALPD